MSKKYSFNTKWDKYILLCACLESNPCCNKHNMCEVIELTHNPFDDIEECMKQRKYKRNSRGAIEQKR